MSLFARSQRYELVGILFVSLLGGGLAPFVGPHTDAYRSMIGVLLTAPQYGAPAVFYAVWGVVYLAYVIFLAVALILLTQLWHALRRSDRSGRHAE